jgi:WD40 repeat protein
MDAGGQQQQPPQSLVGHQKPVTSLLSFDMPGGAGTFILSGSLDGTVKAWNATTGECVASETHTDGVVSMALGQDAAHHPVLLLGLVSGSIQCRNLGPTAKMPAFQLLFSLDGFHDGAVKCVTAGPSATFYTGGADGAMNVFLFAGDLGL